MIDYVRVWQHPKPSITTSPATEVTSNSAKVSGSVNPNGLPTTYYIQYGDSPSYGATIHTPPGSPIGSGTAPIAVWNVLSGLEAETTYHYRIVAVNASGTSYGSDQAFTTGPATYGSPSVLLDQADDQMWVHSRSASTGTLGYANWNASGWSTGNLGTTTIRAGSKPAPLLDKTTKQQWVHYVDSEGQLKYWLWKEGKWSPQSVPVATAVKANTSPAAAFDQTTKQQWVYYVGTDSKLKLWNWTQAKGWIPYELGEQVAPGTSPTVSYDETTSETSVYFVRPNATIGQLRWTGQYGWQQATLGGAVRARTSPNVVLHQGSQQQWIYFVASDGALKYFNYNPATPGGWTGPFALSAEVAPNTSPTAIIDPATYQQWVYYADPSGNIDYWNWTGANGWLPYSLSASVAPGTSVATALDLTTKQQWVYYRDSGGSIFYWNWNGAAGGWHHFP
jgi:hypothetical protein